MMHERNFEDSEPFDELEFPSPSGWLPVLSWLIALAFGACFWYFVAKLLVSLL